MNNINIIETNYYDTLGLTSNATTEEIILKYNILINQYKIIPFLTFNHKNHIKELDIAKFILTNNEYRTKYDIINNSTTKIPQTAICDRLFSLK
uniref:J domain-containing protein n=1 Tax=Megaviridae environmental sample TaxID=1737588 RepID=A0A5J6VL78_9VIRU|nr:MAG: hypothetical protein [Megaviridae environmental sample]